MRHILLSRVDNLGDVVLTLPVAGVLKELYPGIRVTFLGKRYTQPLIAWSEHIDAFLDWDDLKRLPQPEQVARFQALCADVILHIFPHKQIAKLAKKADIPLRIGTNHRIYHWRTCNQRIPLGRKRSALHEAQLNLKLLIPLGAKEQYDLSEISHYYGLTRVKPLKQEFQHLISGTHFNLILHPKSKGSAREWGLGNFTRLIDLLPEEHFRILVTGTREEQTDLQEFLHRFSSRITDATGRLTGDDLISLLHAADGIVAASTGPLHIAAALGKYAIGLYAPMRPIHPGRWGPVGKHADFLVLDKSCHKCRKTLDCECIRSIDPGEVKNKIIEAYRRVC